MTAYFTLQWEDDHVVMLDQRLLPGEVRYIPIFSVEEMAEAIRNMTVRGAPAIGAAAAYGMALAALTAARKHEKVYEQATAAQTLLFAARPTAVNLGWALRRMRRRLDSAAGSLNNAEMAQTLLAEAHAIAEEDRATNRRMAENALALLPDGSISEASVSETLASRGVIIDSPALSRTTAAAFGAIETGHAGEDDE